MKPPSDCEASLRFRESDFGESQTFMVFRSNENESLKIRPAETSRHCSTRVLPWLRRSVAGVTENAATMGVDMGHGLAVIDLVLHMYRRSPTRRKLAELWCVSRRLAMRRDFFFQPCAKEVSIAIPSGQAHRVSSPEPIRAIFDATRFVQTIPTPDRRHRSR